MNKQELIERLRKLANREMLPENINCGLCLEISLELMCQSRLQDKFDQAILKWPKHSGLEEYPIIDPDLVMEPRQIYLHAKASGYMWNPLHPYGALRLELCGFIADELEKEP